MKYLNQEEFMKATAGKVYWNGRWEYLSIVISLLRKYDAHSILELGTNGLKLAEDSDTMEKVTTVPATYHHDATVTPWPIADKQYDFFVALQVFEHFDLKRQKQVQAFSEACRVAKNVILSLPYKWQYSDEMHNGIDDEVVLRWAGGRKWNESYVAMKRKIYLWNL